jgi:rhomboid protease GluP
MSEFRPRWAVPSLPRKREAIEDVPPLQAESPRATATIVLIVAFVLVFLLELAHSAILLPGLQAPALETLVLLGGGAGPLVFGNGEYYRLLTLGFLHGGFMHLAMNALCLFALGKRLEARIGARWFLALFFTGTIAASLVSLSWNAPEAVSVGASGGIMAVAGFLGVAGLRLPPGITRKRDLDLARGLIVATLLVGLFAGLILPIDNAAHLGGLAFGSALAFLLRPIWHDPRGAPGLPVLALGLTLSGLALLGFGLVAIVSRHL